jgi:hypothetical protein
MAFWLGGSLIIAVLSARRIRRSTNQAQVWALISVAALLLSPLAEVHYAIVGVGPIALVFSESRRWRALWIIGIALSLPYAVIGAFHHGVVGTMTIGSAYALATIALWSEIQRPMAASAPSTGARPSSNRVGGEVVAARAEAAGSTLGV